MATTKKVTAKKASTKVVSIDDAPKKIATRKKLVKVNDEVIKKTVMEDAMNKPEVIENDNKKEYGIKMTDIKDFCANHNHDEISSYFINNKIIERNFIPYDKEYAAAKMAVDYACINADNNFEKDSVALELFATVLEFYLYTNIDFNGMSYSEAFDTIREYGLLNLIHEITQSSDNVYIYALRYVDDIETNTFSTSALLKKLITVISGLIDPMTELAKNPDVIKSVIGQNEG
jgi:hypothetical protein